VGTSSAEGQITLLYHCIRAQWAVSKCLFLQVLYRVYTVYRVVWLICKRAHRRARGFAENTVYTVYTVYKT